MVKFDGREPLRFLVESLSLGNTVPVQWEGFPAVIVHDPKLIQSILVDQQRKFVRSGGPPRLGRLLGNGLLRSQGETHLKQRRLTQQAFQPKHFQRYERQIAETVTRHLDSISAKSVIDIHPFLTELTISVVGKTFFGLDWGNEVRALGVWLNYLVESLPTHPKRWREKFRAFLFERVCRKVDQFLFEQIAKKDSTDSSLLSVLVGARDFEGDQSGMNREQLRDELMTMLIAGHETLTSVLSWAFFLLAGRPDIQRAVREDGAPTQISITGRVFQEALRLYPPAWILFRKALEPADLDEKAVHPGEHIIVSPYALGRHPTWFEHPLEFNPDRWISVSYPEGLHIPFGLGNRRCIGEKFSWVEALPILKQFCDRFTFALAPNTLVRELPRFTLRPSPGVPLLLSK